MPSIELEIEAISQSPLTAAYLDAGEGLPVLMLHGFLSHKNVWQPLIEQLSPCYRCLSLDLLGFGDSAKPAISYNVALEVAFVRQFLQALNIDKCAIMGHSFGSWVAAAYALAYSSDVTSLILTAPAGIRDDSFCGRYDHLRPVLWKTPLVDWALWLAKPWVNSVVMQEIMWMRRELMANPAAHSFIVERQRPEDAIDTVEKDIYRLRSPTLVIAAECDGTIPLWHSQTYAGEIPGAQLEIIPGADHALPQKYSSELAPIIIQFLARHSLNISAGDR